MKLQKVKTTTLTVTIFIFLIVASFSPITKQALGANNVQKYFNLSLTISNSAPTVQAIGTSSATPSEGTTTTIHIYFNITDANGYTDIDPTQAYANITKGAVTRTSSGCVNYAIWTSGNNRGVDCSININYFDEPGLWNVSIRAQDASATLVDANGTNLFTMNTLYAFALTKDTVTFGSASPGATGLNASNDPQILNNTGNGNFVKINLTGYELANGNGAFIGAGNFTVNASNDAKGAAVGSNIQISGASLNRASTQDLYIWVDIPAGIGNGTYTTNTTTQWMVEAYN